MRTSSNDMNRRTFLAQTATAAVAADLSIPVAALAEPGLATLLHKARLDACKELKTRAGGDLGNSSPSVFAVFSGMRHAWHL